MSLAVVSSRAEVGVNAPEVTVEAHITRGLPAFSIVGLPETAVKESRDRVRGALINSLFEFPRQRITVNLAPADLPKEGGRFDLPIALGVLAASRQIPARALEETVFLGELALSGELRPIRGALVTALALRGSGKRLVLPAQSAAEAALVSGVEVLAAEQLLEVTAALRGEQPLPPAVAKQAVGMEDDTPGLDDVVGQPFAKRALEIAAAGAHSMLMFGPPGTGKTMLASRLPGILPPMEEDEALEAAAIQSLGTRGFDIDTWRQRPFRSPHHSASGAALVGGGSHPRPGEVSLAHRGVLFLDELPEFDRKVLEVLREPLESGTITVSRAALQAEFPARFLLVAAMNPCPCGYLGDRSGRCRCTEEQIRRYRAKISGPLLDRIDLHVEVAQVPREALRQEEKSGESSAQVRARVVAARNRQLQRQGKPNSALQGRELKRHCALDDPSQQLLEQAMQRFGLSARAYHRIQKVARSIADLASAEHIAPAHIAEAVQLRRLDRSRTAY
ncbi:MAG: YifB family Mg chelatase-like AAA ATPase [Pseudomonadota bacterium]|nr:YifB family Mg chelatase-like AAA ATPase [Pseudomonadota bacterium]